MIHPTWHMMLNVCSSQSCMDNDMPMDVELFIFPLIIFRPQIEKIRKNWKDSNFIFYARIRKSLDVLPFFFASAVSLLLAYRFALHIRCAQQGMGSVYLHKCTYIYLFLASLKKRLRIAPVLERCLIFGHQVNCIYHKIG